MHNNRTSNASMVNSLKPKSLTTICLYITSGLMGGDCLADTIWLTNGDRISGEIEQLDATTLKVKTEYAPAINIQRTAIKSFATDALKTWQHQSEPRATSITQSDTPGYVTIDNQQIPISELSLTHVEAVPK